MIGVFIVVTSMLFYKSGVFESEVDTILRFTENNILWVFVIIVIFAGLDLATKKIR